MITMKKIFSMLALLLMAVTGAWAQTEELLTSITTDRFKTITYSTAGCATLTTSGNVEVSMVDSNVEIYRWTNSSPYNMGSLTVTPSEGYTITKVVFKGYDQYESKWFDVFTDTEAPYTCYMKSSEESLSENMENSKWDGIGQIDVYGYATYSVTLKAGTEDAANWTITPTSAKAGETVTIKYKGTKKVKSVKAVKK